MSRRRNNKAREPIAAAAVDNWGNDLFDTSRIDPLIGKIISTVTTSSHLEAMSVDDEGFAGDGDDSVSSFADTMLGTPNGTLPPLSNIWECPQINMGSREGDNGSLIHGWTCNYCPMPARGPPHFFKYLNATKALAHVLRIKGASVSACKGNIPFAKRVQYKALYNTGRVKSKMSSERKAELDYDIAESQDRVAASHYPAAM